MNVKELVQSRKYLAVDYMKENSISECKVTITNKHIPEPWCANEPAPRRIEKYLPDANVYEIRYWQRKDGSIDGELIFSQKKID